MTPTPSNTAMPATPAPVPATAAQVMAALKRMHDRLDQLMQLIQSRPQP